MNSWQESPAALIFQPPRRSVRPTSTPVAATLVAGTAACAEGSSAARPVDVSGCVTPDGGGSGAPVTEPVGAAASGAGARDTGSSRPNGIMLQPDVSRAVSPSIARAWKR